MRQHCAISNHAFDLFTGDWRLAYDIRATELDIKVARFSAALRSKRSAANADAADECCTKLDAANVLPERYWRARWQHRRNMGTCSTAVGTKRRRVQQTEGT